MTYDGFEIDAIEPTTRSTGRCGFVFTSITWHGGADNMSDVGDETPLQKEFRSILSEYLSFMKSKLATTPKRNRDDKMMPASVRSPKRKRGNEEVAVFLPHGPNK